LLGFVLAELEAFVAEQPARATAPAVRNPVIRSSLLRREVRFMSRRMH
jgi:hypothetical protein